VTFPEAKPKEVNEKNTRKERPLIVDRPGRSRGRLRRNKRGRMKLASKQRDERNNQILGGDTTEFQSRGRDQDQSSPRALKGAHEAFKIHSTQTGPPIPSL